MRSAFWTPDADQFRSSYLGESMHIALRLVSESDSISRSSVSFCLSTSRIAPSSAQELDAILSPWLSSPSLIDVSPAFISIPAHPPVGSISLFTLAGSLSLRKGSLAFDLCPGNLPKILMPSSRLCVDLVSGLYNTST